MTNAQSIHAVKTQHLYRLFAEDGTLLYIGISKSALGRIPQHLDTQPWADEVATVRIERHAVSRFRVEQMERAAIIAEHPKYNKVHNNGQPNGTYTASDPFNHSWLRQFCADDYALMQDAVGHFSQAYCDFRSPGDTTNTAREIWTQVFDAMRYYDAHDCSRPDAMAFTLPFRRDESGWCYYKCQHCGYAWKCWWS